MRAKRPRMKDRWPEQQRSRKTVTLSNTGMNSHWANHNSNWPSPPLHHSKEILSILRTPKFQRIISSSPHVNRQKEIQSILQILKHLSHANFPHLFGRKNHSNDWWKLRIVSITPCSNSNKVLVALTLPQPSMEVFSGGPINYCDFLRTFEHQVEQKIQNPSFCLYYLVQYTSGRVQELTRSCLSVSEFEGYKEARKLLKDRYGQGYRIATAHVKRLTEGSPIKAEDGTAPPQFSIQLSSCVSTLKVIGCFNRLDNPDNLPSVQPQAEMERTWTEL